MAACPLRRRCNCSTHAPCSTHTPSPRMRSYFGRRCYFSVHAPIVFGMRERDATEPSGRRLAHTLLCSQGGGRRCHRMRGLRGLERIPGEQHPDGAQVRDGGGGGHANRVYTRCVTESLPRADVVSPVLLACPRCDVYGRQSGERRDGGVARARNHMFDMSQVEVFERMDHGVPWMGQPRLAVSFVSPRARDT